MVRTRKQLNGSTFRLMVEELASSSAARTGAADLSHQVPLALALERQGSDFAEPLCRRHRLRATNARPTNCGAWPERSTGLDLSPTTPSKAGVSPMTERFPMFITIKFAASVVASVLLSYARIRSRYSVDYVRIWSCRAAVRTRRFFLAVARWSRAARRLGLGRSRQSCVSAAMPRLPRPEP